MLTPRFEVSQSSESVTVVVFAPFARVADVEITTVENIFIFYCAPYYLRLTFDGKLIDSELEKHKSAYDADKKSFTFTCMKATPGEDFHGLDMLTQLLTPKGNTRVEKPVIEDLSGEYDANSEDESGDTMENEWLFEQTVADEESILPSTQKYGFAGNNCGVFNRLTKELHELIDLKDPDNKAPLQRREERLLDERSRFNEDHYLADLYEDEVAVDAIQFIPAYYSITADEVCLNEIDNEDLLKLPRKRYLLDSGNQTTSVFMGLVDLIFCWCYNHRVTKGEDCSESPWNIKKLSPTLSWLDSFTNLKGVLVASFRRSLCFPIIRNWKLSQEVLKDTQKIFSLGQKQVLKCLLDIQRILNSEEPHYILNELYVSDYCVWIQQVNDGKLLRLSDDIKQMKIEKSYVDLELDELEEAAEMVIKEQQQIDNSRCVNGITEDLQSLSIIENSMAANFNENAPSHYVLPTGDPLPAVSDADSDDSSSSSDSDSDADNDSSSSSSESSEDTDDNSSSELDSDDDSDS